MAEWENVRILDHEWDFGVCDWDWDGTELKEVGPRGEARRRTQGPRRSSCSARGEAGMAEPETRESMDNRTNASSNLTLLQQFDDPMSII